MLDLSYSTGIWLAFSLPPVFNLREFEGVKNGTMVSITLNCPKCGNGAFVWKSQPTILGGFPAGKLLLSFGVLMAGASFIKVHLVLKHAGMNISISSSNLLLKSARITGKVTSNHLSARSNRWNVVVTEDLTQWVTLQR